MSTSKTNAFINLLTGVIIASHITIESLASTAQQYAQKSNVKVVNNIHKDKRRLVVKVQSTSDLSYLKHKGLLAGFQKYIEEKYDVVYTADINDHADIFLITGFSRNFNVWRNLPKDSFRWLFGLDKNKMTPQRICGDSSPIKILYSHETWTSYPEGFDDCFDLMISYDLRVDHPRYMTIAGTAYEYFYDKVSTDYDHSKDVYRADGCQPNKRKYDVCFLSSNAGGKDFMDLTEMRINLFNALSEKTYAVSGGKVENNIGYTVARGDELNWMKNCKFVISYENRIYPGYITEKPYQAWLAGAIPIYAADRSVFGNIDREAVVFGPDYETTEAIVDHVVGLLKDENAYCQIWNRALHVDPDKNYKVYQNSVRDRLVEIVEDKIES